MFMCPVCNGLQSISFACPQCRTKMADEGRVDDYLGPYSPYRPIDDLKLTNGYTDLSTHQCVHSLSCPQCGKQLTRSVQEWHDY
jgi:predicted RNA-binding Zn-ribbon protein involved in translation (DUF1610 family)